MAAHPSAREGVRRDPTASEGVRREPTASEGVRRDPTASEGVRRDPTTPEGVLLVDKPSGITSHDVVAAVRRALGGAKTGHCGTLDPFATGLLLILIGRATKLQSRLLELRKSYETLAELGSTSTTGDPEGEIKRTGRIPPDPPHLPTGEVRQRPPAHSAVKIRGERAYKRARRGEQIEMPERIVTVYRFEQVWREGEHARFEIECSSGTYVRSLIADLGDAYCVELRRTRIGPFDVADAVAPPRRGESWSLPSPRPDAGEGEAAAFATRGAGAAPPAARGSAMLSVAQVERLLQ